MQRIFPTVIVVLVGLIGCDSSVPPDVSPTTSAQRWTAYRPIAPPGSQKASPSAPSSATPSERSPVQSFNTGDCDIWPHYDFPMEFQIDTPSVPEELIGPAPVLSAP